MRCVYAALVTAILIGGCTSSETDSPAATSAPETVVSTSTTTTTTVPPTATTVPPTTTTTTEAAPDVAALWLEAMAEYQFPVAESLSSGSAEQAARYLSITHRLDPSSLTEDITDVDLTETSVEWTFDDGFTIAYDNLSVSGGKVTDYDRNGSPISGMFSLESGEPAEVADVTVTVIVVYHRPDPSYGHVTFVAVEIDNQSGEDVYGYAAELVGSDRRSVEVESYTNGSYTSGVISDDILTFLGADLSEGGELWIDATYKVTVKAPVPAVPPTS